MKKLILCMGALSALLLAACSTTSTTTVPTPAQIATDVCPAVIAAEVALQAIPNLQAGVQSSLTKAAPLIDAVCTTAVSAQAANVSDLRSLPAMVFPILTAAVQASSMQNKTQITSDLQAAQIIVTAIVKSLPQTLPATLPAAPASPPTTPASSAPTK